MIGVPNKFSEIQSIIRAIVREFFIGPLNKKGEEKDIVALMKVLPMEEREPDLMYGQWGLYIDEREKVIYYKLVTQGVK